MEVSLHANKLFEERTLFNGLHKKIISWIAIAEYIGTPIALRYDSSNHLHEIEIDLSLLLNNLTMIGVQFTLCLNIGYPWYSMVSLLIVSYLF